MRISRLILKNWRNFSDVNIRLARRVFLVGNNGVGKSNLMDAVRFLHDIVKEDGGGLQSALNKRGGMQRIRSVHARKNPRVEIGIELSNDEVNGANDTWEYHLKIKKEQDGNHRLLVASERVLKNGVNLLDRPDEGDTNDSENLKQTALEQTRANKKFRELAAFLQKASYLHMVPQLVRDAKALQANVLPDDPYGQNLFNEMGHLPTRIRNPRLATITKAMQAINPSFGDFEFVRDNTTGIPHLIYKHKNWRKRDIYQNEMQLSDGELRLIGLLWALLKSDNLLMLEEPELSFNEGIIRELPSLLAQATLAHKKRPASQVIISTHSPALLSDEGIGCDEIVSLQQTKSSNTTAIVAADEPLFASQFKAGLTAAEIVLPFAQSNNLNLVT